MSTMLGQGIRDKHSDAFQCYVALTSADAMWGGGGKRVSRCGHICPALLKGSVFTLSLKNPSLLTIVAACLESFCIYAALQACLSKSASGQVKFYTECKDNTTNWLVFSDTLHTYFSFSHKHALWWKFKNWQINRRKDYPNSLCLYLYIRGQEEHLSWIIN